MAGTNLQKEVTASAKMKSTRILQAMMDSAKAPRNEAMTKTRLDVLFMSPHLVCPPNKQYGQLLSDFYCSRIHKFGDVNDGKLWQIRCLKKEEKYYAFPIILNTGGTAYNKPILADPVLARLGVTRGSTMERVALQQGLVFPTPLGDEIDPMHQDWDSERKKEITNDENGMRYNLVGHSLAQIIVALNELAGNVLKFTQMGEEREFIDKYVARTLKATVDRYAEVGAKEEYLQRELDCMLTDVNEDGVSVLPWTTSHLPVPSKLWVH
mmetsp:Transcript_61750/g.147318  ORF Transcript_61750/g.147318 Transcript_61750/m.147318 type:complete len:267 (+) Transcript_61750:249-1049(+)